MLYLEFVSGEMLSLWPYARFTRAYVQLPTKRCNIGYYFFEFQKHHILQKDLDERTSNLESEFR